MMSMRAENGYIEKTRKMSCNQKTFVFLANDP